MVLRVSKTGVTAGCVVATESPNRRFVRVRNSQFLKSDLSVSSSGSSSLKSSKVSWMGTSVMMVASSFERRAWSEKLMTFSFCFPLSLSVFSSSPSTEPYWATSFLAVFSPIPGTPGMLSEASPQRPRISMTCLGSLISQFFKIFLIYPKNVWINFTNFERVFFIASYCR